MSNRYQRNARLRYEKERRKNLLARPGVHRFVLILDQLKPGFNVAKIFRSAEAFGAAAVHLIGIGPFDPAPAKGSFRKVPARFFDSFSDCHLALQQSGYLPCVLDPQADRQLAQTSLPEKVAFIFGHEELGSPTNVASVHSSTSLRKFWAAEKVFLPIST